MPESYIQIPTYDPDDPDQPVIENPAAGMVRFRLDTNTIEIYNGSEWSTSSAITSRYIQVPQARNSGQYPVNPPVGSMVFNESTQKIDVYNGRDWRPGVNVPLMRPIYDLPSESDFDEDDLVIVERIIPGAGSSITNKTYKTTISNLLTSDVFVNGVMNVIDEIRTTDDIEEGTNNLYFTEERSRDSISAETLISVEEALGTLSYNSTSGVMSYLGPTRAEIRASIGVQNSNPNFGFGHISYDSAAGVITYNSPDTETLRGVISMGPDSTNGLNQLYYNSTTGELTHIAVTESAVRDLFSLEEDDQASYDASTGTFYAPGPNSSVTFSSLTVTDLNTETLTFTGTGGITLSSATDLSFSAGGLINLQSLVTLPRLTLAELNGLSFAPVGTIAYCTDPTLGDPRPVQMTSTGWRDFMNGVL